MRGTLPLLSRAPADSSRARSPPLQSENPPARSIPTIRLISAIPSAAGSASELHTSFGNVSDTSSYVSVQPASSPLAPKQEEQSTRRRLVPKRSKLGILGNVSSKAKDRGPNSSDVTQRVGSTHSASKSGFEIYVDSSYDTELGDLMVIKKKKSRAALNGLKW